MPKTFRDALSVASRLGLYLWVDSFCIIQESREDWAYESAQMSLVYANAEITISATAAKNCTEGLFFDRRPELLGPCKVDVAMHTQNAEQHIAIDMDVWKDGVELAPVNTRAWVVQERDLSRRIIHFAKEQLFWECRCLATYESTPRGRLTDIFAFPGSIRPPKIAVPEGSIPPTSREKALQAWYYAIEHYSKSALTFETDRLVAIAGLAKVVSTITQDTYVAGMWQTDFIPQLAWYPLTTKKDRKEVYREYEAPS